MRQALRNHSYPVDAANQDNRRQHGADAEDVLQETRIVPWQKFAEVMREELDLAQVVLRECADGFDLPMASCSAHSARTR